MTGGSQGGRPVWGIAMPSVVTVRNCTRSLPVLGAAAVLASAGAFAAAAPSVASPVSKPDPLPSVRLVAEPVLTVSAVTLNRSRVAVSGLNTMPVRVTVAASYPTQAQGGSDVTSLTAILTRSPKVTWPGLNGLRVPLRRVGTAQAPGTWTGVANIPSTLSGTLKVTAVTTTAARDDGSDMTAPISFDGPSVRVTGVHVPAIAAAAVPRRPARTVRSYAISGQVVDTATKAPYRSRIPVQLVIDGSCWRGIPCTVRTDTRGRFTFKVPNKPIGSPPSRPVSWGHNLWLTGAAKDADGFGTLLLVRPVTVR